MASIQPRKVGGVIVGYYSVLGKDKITGRVPRKFHKTKADADAFIASQEVHHIGTGELYRQKHQIIACIQRLAERGATITDATEFYLRLGLNKKPRPVGEVIDELIEEKKMKGIVGKNHIDDLKIKLGTFRKSVGEDTIIGEITQDQLVKYIYVTQNGLSNSSKINHIRILSLLFNYAKKKGYIAVLPTEGFEKPKQKFEAPKVMTPEDFETLLNHCYKNKWYDRVAVFVLQGFCGIRKQEISRLKWSDVDLENKIVSVSAEIAKGPYYRNNVIPENGLKWLVAIHDKRETGPIIGANWTTLIRSAISSAKIKHPKNAIRHSFCSYALGAGRDEKEVSRDMGHLGDVKMMADHYRNVATKAASLKWWDIVPKD